VTVLSIRDNVRLLDYFESSFLGEFEVIFRQPAERTYIAVNKKMIPTVST